MNRLKDIERDTRMYLSRVLTKSLAPPDWVSVNLTLQCNLKCVMCTTCYDIPQELTTREVKSIIDQTALMGVRVFNPLGGELFMRPDLEEILHYAARRDFYITVTTNGTLINRKRADAIARIPSNALHFIISLDGAEPVHDRIRGEGMYRRAMKGYRRLREADAAAGNPRRKVLANTIIHARNLDTLPALLDDLAVEGFEGVQLLNLFRHGQQATDDPGGLWIHPKAFEALSRLVEELVRRVEAQRPGAFQILNPVEDLRLILPYYRDELRPLEAPCWAGWKELYINADGQAIMCDGELEFLNGTFGSVRHQTLRQIWDSPELKARRRVVKACTTPCMQNCYLRRDSDSARQILRGAATLAVDELKRRVRRRRASSAAGLTLPHATLTLELSDTAPWAEPDAAAARRHFDNLVRDSPAPIDRCYEEPFSFYEYRNRGYIKFDRGFMGFELVRKIVGDLLAAELRFGALDLTWRGEPLMHPELVPVLRYLFERMDEDGAFHRLRITTDGRLLNTEIADVASFFGHIPQTWVIRGNSVDPWEEQVLRNVDYFLHVRKPAQEVVASWIVHEALDPHRFVETWSSRLQSPWIAVGRPRPRGDGIWFSRTDHDHFQANADARARLTELAEVLDVVAEPGAESAPRRCPGPFATPTVSGDGKVTLCPRERQLRNRVGEATSDSLARLWTQEPAVVALRRDAQGKGVPGGDICRDCHFMYSPNYRQATPEDTSPFGQGGTQ